MKDKFWLFYETECLDEGSVFPFATREAAESFASSDVDYVFEEREATDEEQEMIDYGRDTTRSRIEELEGALRERVRDMRKRASFLAPPSGVQLCADIERLQALLDVRALAQTQPETATKQGRKND